MVKVDRRMGCRLLSQTALALWATVVLLTSTWTGVASAAAGSDMRGVWVITGQYSQKTTIISMNMATGEFSGTGVATNGTGYTWPSKGSVGGSTKATSITRTVVYRLSKGKTKKNEK